MELVGRIRNHALGLFRTSVQYLYIAPFYRVKKLYQVAPELVRQQRLHQPFTGLLDALEHTKRWEPPLALWRGILYQVAFTVPARAWNQLAATTVKRLVIVDFKKATSHNELWLMMLARGSLTIMMSFLVAIPLQLTETVLLSDVASDLSGYLYSNPVEVWRKTLEHSGLFGLFTGYSMALASTVVYRGVFFLIWDHLAHRIIGDRKKRSARAEFVFRWIDVFVAGMLAHPFGVIRQRMMIAAPTPWAYSSPLDCALTIWQNEGFEGFFRGYLINFLEKLASPDLRPCRNCPLVLLLGSIKGTSSFRLHK